MTISQFETLLEQHGDPIFGFCYHLAGNKADAEDLYQDSVMKAFGKLSILGGDTSEELISARNYIIGIAVRLHRNFRRKKANSSLHSDSALIIDQLRDSADIVTDTEQKDIRTATRAIVSGLPEKLRVVTYMFYYAEMSVADIAEQLRVPEGTVKSRLNRARAQIRTELEGKEYGREQRSYDKEFA